MINNEFPKITQSSQMGEIGVNAVSMLVNNDLKWIFRKNHKEDDFGIDAYIDVVTDNGSVTGQCFAVQIKTGQSYFQTETSNGFVFHGETKHLNYYMNCPMPVLILLYDNVINICYWVIFAPEKTESTKKGWKINVLKNNILGVESKGTLLDILGPADNHLDALKAHWFLNDFFSKSEIIFYAIDRLDVESGNVELIHEFFKRLEINDNLTRKLQGRIEIMISGFDDDNRELWEIKEVLDWFKKANDTSINWFFFLNPTPFGRGLKLYYACCCCAKRVNIGSNIASKIKVELDNSLIEEFLITNFGTLNQMTEHLGMSIEENKIISFSVMDAIGIPHGS
jgi:hypothetical protein